MKGSANADLALILGLLSAAGAAEASADAAAAWKTRRMQNRSANRLQSCQRRSQQKHVSSRAQHAAAAVRGGGLSWFAEDIEVFPEDLDYGDDADGSSGLPAAPQSLLSSPRSQPDKRSSAAPSKSSSGSDSASERNTALVSPAKQPRRQQQQQRSSNQQSEGGFFQRRGSSSAAKAPSLQRQQPAQPARSPLLQDRLPALDKGEPVSLTPVRTPLHAGLVDALTDGGKPLLVWIWGALLGGVALRGWDTLRRRGTRNAGLLTDSSNSSSSSSIGSSSSNSSSSSDGSSQLSPQQLQDQLAAYERDRARAVALVRDLKAARRRDADAYKEHMQDMQAHIDTLTLAKGELESSIAVRVREGLAGAVEAAKQSGAEDAREEARAEVIVLQQQVRVV
jgi:hypothetical protein